MIERLFQFFDDNPEVPQALIVSEDGDVTRDGLRVIGTPGLQNGHVVPTVYESMAGLLVTRSDRVDRYIRRYATHEREDNQNKDTDLGKLWAFYWKQSREFLDVYEESERAKGAQDPLAPGTMSTAYWQSQLPTLWQTISNRGPGEFEPSPWLPIRWAQHQVKEFDAAPVLGYLHRPIKVSMQDENGKRLKPALQARALQAGWLQALDTLPEGHKPVRVFYDTTDNQEAEIALTLALHSLNTDGHGIELGNVDEGYNIGRRLGNTGVSSALVEINLATIASYLDGGASAVVYAGADGSLTVQMIRPPSEARKEKNRQNRGADPFKFGSPSGGAPKTMSHRVVPKDPFLSKACWRTADMNPVMRWGIAAVVGPISLIFSVHWWGKAVASERAELAAYKADVKAKIAERQATQVRTYALEIRGVGLAVDDWHQSSIWRETKKTNNNFTSIYSRDPKDYDSSLSSREITRNINIRVAFKHSASESVAYWPIPVFSHRAAQATVRYRGGEQDPQRSQCRDTGSHPVFVAGRSKTQPMPKA